MSSYQYQSDDFLGNATFSPLLLSAIPLQPHEFLQGTQFSEQVDATSDFNPFDFGGFNSDLSFPPPTGTAGGEPYLAQQASASDTMFSYREPELPPLYDPSSFGSNLDQNMNTIDVPQLLAPSRASSASMTPEVRTPSDATLSRSLSPKQLYPASSVDFPTYLPCCSAVSGNSSSLHKATLPSIKEEPQSPVLPPIPSFARYAFSAGNISPVAGKVSQLSAAGLTQSRETKSTHRKAKPQKKTRSSTSTAMHKRVACTSSSTPAGVRCTVPGCSEILYDVSTRDRHIKSIHNRIRPYCPGMCRTDPYSRNDALKRHLLSRRCNPHCRKEAMKLGWNPNIMGSITKLEGFRPTPRM